MEETIGEASLRDAAIGTGIAVDKMLALTGQRPSLNLNIANIPLPSEEERAKLSELHYKLDRIAAKLNAQSARERGDEELALQYEMQMHG